MSENFVLLIEDFENLEFIDGLEENIIKNAIRATNKVARDIRASSAKAIRKEIAFPARYLSSVKKNNLAITQYASIEHIQAQITGKYSKTNLSTFVINKNAKKLRVQVAPGKRKLAPIGSFFFGKKGNENKAIAVRLKEGQRAAPGKKTASNIWTDDKGNRFDILSGPAVNQVFRNLIPEQQELAIDKLIKEFDRLMEAGIK